MKTLSARRDASTQQDKGVLHLSCAVSSTFRLPRPFQDGKNAGAHHMDHGDKKTIMGQLHVRPARNPIQYHCPVHVGQYHDTFATRAVQMMI